MDIRALSQLTGGNTSGSAMSVPVDTRALISEIAASTSLTDNERSSLIAAAAKVDSGLTGAVRSQALQQVHTLGLYLRNTGNSGFPRWTMMTALRSYGMNLTAETTEASATAEARTFMQKAVQNRSVSVETAIAAASRSVAPPVQQAPEPRAVAAKAVATPAESSPRIEKIA